MSDKDLFDMLNSMPEPERRPSSDIPDWAPAPDEELTGVITDVRSLTGPNGSWNLLVLRRPDGSLIQLPCGRQRLEEQFNLNKPQVGDAIRFRYLGMITTGTGRQMHDYTPWLVVRGGPAGPYDQHTAPF